MLRTRRFVNCDVLVTRGGVLEDTFWSPWPWPRRSSFWPWPQVLENWPVLGSRTALFFELLKFCGALEKFFEKRFFVEIAWKIFVKTFFCFCFGEHLRLCPWSLALSIPVLGLESVCPRKGCPWPWPRIFFVSLALASSLVSSTPPLLVTQPSNKLDNRKMEDKSPVHSIWDDHSTSFIAWKKRRYILKRFCSCKRKRQVKKAV